MNHETAEPASEHDVRRKALWAFSLGSLIAMLYYEYTWSRFALHNGGTISFGGWLSASLSIVLPWSLCFICLRELRHAVRNGKVEQGVGWSLSVWIGTVMVFVYTALVTEIQRLTTLGALK